MTASRALIRRLETSFVERAPPGGNRVFAAGNWILFAGLMFAAAAAGGQIVKDPMRPPGEYLTHEAMPDANAPATLVLQSVKISRSDRAAIISGKVVRQGDRIGSATVLKISDGEVVLKDGDAEQVLKLYPAVDKQAADRRTGTGTRDAAAASAPSVRSGTAIGGGRR